MNAIRGKRAELDEIASARRALIAEGAAQAARSIKKAEEAAAVAAATHTLRHQCGNPSTRLPRCARWRPNR